MSAFIGSEVLLGLSDGVLLAPSHPREFADPARQPLDPAPRQQIRYNPRVPDN